MEAVSRHWFNINKGHPLSERYYLMESLLVPCALTVGYYVTVKKIGPKFMENREPYELKKAILIYNFLQIIINAWLFIKGATAVLDFDIRCVSVENTLPLLDILYYYLLVKISDFIETLFFVLRKRQRQVSFLHLYHHIAMIWYSWTYFKYFPGGQTIYLFIANTLVHCVMYTYYFLTAYDESYKKNVWWKKYVTQLQMLQHLFVTVAFVAPLFSKNCTYPRIATIMSMPNCLAMIALFGNFYKNEYLKSKQKKIK